MQKKIYYYSCLEIKTQNVNPQKKTAHMVWEWFLYYLFGIVFSCVINTQCEKCSLHTLVDVWIDMEWYEAGVEMAVTVDIKEKYWIFWTFF